MEVEMRIRGLMMDPMTNMPIVVLKDVGGDSVLPIWVGVYEANAIAMEIEKVTTPRPMTHDLIKNLLIGLDTRVHKIVVRIRQNDKAFLRQDACGLDQAFVVREQRLGVTDDFQLDPIRQPNFTGQSRGPDRVVGVIAGSCIRKNEEFRAVDVIQQGFLGPIRQIHAPDRDGYDFRARRLVTARHLVKAAVLTSANE